jgi:hypothetical protein
VSAKTVIRFYRMASITDGAPHDSRYFARLKRAESEAKHLAEIFAVTYRKRMRRVAVGQFGIVAVWGRGETEIRIEECDVES